MKKTNPEIAQALDVSERHVRNVKKLYAEQGISGSKPKRRGRRNGEPKHGELRQMCARI
ncbi:MAG: helix-turn-helix domain-containing protein [Desulfovibrio sp.]|nr:helix-turn-helix domain-containing protein [Desulfovibrio sp.]